MAGVTKTGHLLSERLAAAGRFDEGRVLAVLEQLAEQVAALHKAGQLHGAIHSDKISIAADGQAMLLPVSESAGEKLIDLPPEFAGQPLSPLPTAIDEARSMLRSAGLQVDPHRVDIYQLGCLACELLTGESAQSYLFSPKAKAKVSPAWRRLIDRLLGYEPSERIATCDALQQELQSLAVSQISSAHVETPPIGTRAEAAGNTPFGLQGASGGSLNLPEVGDDAGLPFAALGHYRIVSRLGSGGMGDVYLGFEPALDRSVAIKVLPPELARQSDFVQRFVDEAKAAARLVHPNIVQIYFIGEDRGHHYFAMQYVPGESLAARIARERTLASDDALRIVEQVVAGLTVAHRRGMIHRDIKPGNILLDADHDRSLLADFGLVKSLASSAAMTATGMVMGTVDYISPEQGRGLAVDGRSDLYSIGVLLYQLVSGRLPFVADSPTAMIFQHAYERPLPLDAAAPHVPRDFARLVHRLLEKDPADRYPSADALLADIGRLRRGERLELPAESELSAVGATSVVIKAPDFAISDEERRVTTELPVVRPISWRERLRARVHELAPEALRNLQNTEHQIDGALAVYEKRRNLLAELAHEARGIERQLAQQVKSHRQAAGEARRGGSSNSDQAASDLAERLESHHAAAAAGLEAQLVQQRDERGEIQLRLAQADAMLSKLQSQRAILKARLRAAAAGRTVDGATEDVRRRRHSTRVRLAVGAIAAAALLGFAAFRSIPRETVLKTVNLDNTLPVADITLSSKSPTPRGPSPLEMLTSDEWEWTPPVNVGPILNSSADDAEPFLSEDGRTIYFRSIRSGGVGRSDIWTASRSRPGQPWSTPVNMGPGFNSPVVDGRPTTTSNGLELYIHSARPGSLGGSDIYVSKRRSTSDPWGELQNLGSPINTDHEENSALVSADGLTLIFVTDRPGVAGTVDSLMSTRPSVNDPWSPPINMRSVNASGSGGAATLSADQLVLVCSSSLGGSGGRDLVMLTRTSIDEQFGNPVNLGPLLNSEADDGAPFLSSDGSELWFSSRRPGGLGGNDLYMTRRVRKNTIASTDPSPLEMLTSDEWEWTTPVNAGPIVNASGDDNAPFMSANRISLYFRSIRSGGLGGADIWVARRPGARQPWTPPVNAGPTINSPAAEGRPSMTADGLLLVMHSTRRGGAGSGDIYTSSRASVDAPWGELVNVGAPINTPRDESRAQISSDGLTIFFSSDRPGGAGLLDLWSATRADRNQAWSEPVNLGAANSTAHEYNPTLSADQLVVIFSTGRSRPGGGGGRDLMMATRPSREAPFGPAVNLGPVVNSAEDDDGPFLFADASTLWFDSHRPGGFGGADMWVTRRVRKQSAAPGEAQRPATIVSASPPATPATSPLTVLTSSEWRWGEVTNAGPVLNSPTLDATTYLAPDGRTLLFGSMRRGGQGNLDIWMSTRPSENDPWDPPVNLGPNINSREWDGSPAMTADGLTLMFESHRPGGRGDFDIYASTRASVDQPWPKAVILDSPISTTALDNGPFISPDGLTLAFASIRGGGVGFVDLWMAKRGGARDPWGVPFNAGLRVNSTIEEWAPRLSSDGLVLLFHSPRAGGHGSEDIWLATRRQPDDAFGRPALLPKPINTEFDDLAGSLSYDGQTLWFSSKRPGGEGDSDLYFVRRLKENEVEAVEASAASSRNSSATAEQSTVQLPAATAPGLFGTMLVGDNVTGRAFHYQMGRILPDSAIGEQVFAAGHSLRDVKLTMRGVLELPRKMVVDVMHNGGSAQDGVHTLLVDGREVGQIGDDRRKTAVYRLSLEPGAYEIEWLLTGGDFGDSVLQFFDAETKQPLPVTIGDKALARAAGAALNVLVTSEQFAIAPISAEVGKQE